MDDLNFNRFEDRQEERFLALDSTLQNGFSQLSSQLSIIAGEIKLLREAGYVPINTLNQILDSNRQITAPIVKYLCIALVLLITWLTGVKYLPEHITKLLAP